MRLAVVVGWIGLCTHGVSTGGVTAGQARHNSSNVGCVTAGQVRHTSSVLVYIMSLCTGINEIF